MGSNAIQARHHVVTVTLTDGNGDPLTGVSPSDVTMYVRKANGPPIQKVIDSVVFNEVDASNLPGLYEITFTPMDLLSPGEFIAVIQENGAINLTQTNIRLDVQSRRLQEEQTSFEGEIRKDQSHTVAFGVMDEQGHPVQAIHPQTIATDVYRNGTQANVSLRSSFQQVQTTADSSVYQFTLPAAEVNQSGDFIVDFRRNPAVSPGGTTPAPQSQSTGVSGDINAAYLNEQTVFNSNQEQVKVPTGFVVTSNGVIRQTQNGGQTWSTPSYSPGSGTFEDVDGDRRTAEANVFVGQDGGGAPRILYANSFASQPVSSSRGSGTTRAVSVRSEDTDVWFITNDGGTYYIEKTTGFSDTSASTSYTGASNEDIFDIEAVTDQVAVAVGQDTNTTDPIVVRTTDGGSNWSVSTPSTSGSALNTVAFVPGREIGYAAGTNGVIYETPDAGATWSRIDGGWYPSTEWRDGFATETISGFATGFFSGFDGSNARYVSTSYGIITPLENHVGSQPGLSIDGVVQRGRLWTGSTGGDLASFAYGTPTMGISSYQFRWRVVDRVESETYNEAVAAHSDAQTAVSEVQSVKGGAFDPSTDSLDHLRALNDTIDGRTVTINNETSQLLTDVANVQGSGFQSNIHSLEAIEGLMQQTKTEQGQEFTKVKGASFSQNQDSLHAMSQRSQQIKAWTQRVLGLSQENVRMTDHQYDQDDNLIAQTIRVYPSKVDVQQQTQPIATYKMEADYDDQGRLQDYRIVLD